MFRPERWIEAASPEADPGQLEDMSSCLEALFGYGRFRCMGRSVAFMQMSKALPEVSFFSPRGGGVSCDFW